MRRMIPVVVTLAWAAPVAAQLTPAQRAAVESRPSAAKSTQLMDSWEQRSLAGDRTAYFGPAAREERRETNERLWRLRSPYTLPPVIYSPSEVAGRDGGPGSNWIAIGMRSGTPTTLRRPDGQAFEARAGIPLRLTLVSPIGAPKKALMIRAAVGTANTAPDWSMMAELSADAQGSYRVDLPTLAAGDYQVLVQVYDPDHPEAPYSSSLTPLFVRQP